MLNSALLFLGAAGTKFRRQGPLDPKGKSSVPPSRVILLYPIGNYNSMHIIVQPSFSNEKVPTAYSGPSLPVIPD
jgi:hypothetical protein